MHRENTMTRTPRHREPLMEGAWIPESTHAPSTPLTHICTTRAFGDYVRKEEQTVSVASLGPGCCMLQQAASLSQLVDHRVCCVCAKLLQLCPTLGGTMDRSSPGFSVHGILQARILKWTAAPFSRQSSWPRKVEATSLMYPALAGGFFTTSTTYDKPT